MRTLLIDTCGEVGSVALADEYTIMGFRELPARSASASLLSSISSLLLIAGWSIKDLDGVGVVSGPGSFTGLRVGLACAKGLCEALGIPVAAVSHLQLLATAANVGAGFAALNAGRGEVYVLDVVDHTESLRSLERFVQDAQWSCVVVTEESLLPKFTNADAELHALDARTALPLVLERLHEGGDDLEALDANYVRNEQQIYGSSLRPKASV